MGASTQETVLEERSRSILRPSSSNRPHIAPGLESLSPFPQRAGSKQRICFEESYEPKDLYTTIKPSSQEPFAPAIESSPKELYASAIESFLGELSSPNIESSPERSSIVEGLDDLDTESSHSSSCLQIDTPPEKTKPTVLIQNLIRSTDCKDILQILYGNGSGGFPLSPFTVKRKKGRWASTCHISPDVCDRWLKFARLGPGQYCHAMEFLKLNEGWGISEWYGPEVFSAFNQDILEKQIIIDSQSSSSSGNVYVIGFDTRLFAQMFGKSQRATGDGLCDNRNNCYELAKILPHRVITTQTLLQQYINRTLLHRKTAHEKLKEKLDKRTQQGDTSLEFKQVAGHFFAGKEVPESFEFPLAPHTSCYVTEFFVGDLTKILKAEPLDDEILVVFLEDCIMSNDFVKASINAANFYGLKPLSTDAASYLKMVALDKNTRIIKKTTSRCQASDDAAVEVQVTEILSAMSLRNYSVTTFGETDEDAVPDTVAEDTFQQSVVSNGGRKRKHKKNKKNKAANKSPIIDEDDEEEYHTSDSTSEIAVEASVNSSDKTPTFSDQSLPQQDPTEDLTPGSSSKIQAEETKSTMNDIEGAARVDSGGSWITIKRGSTQAERVPGDDRTNSNGKGQSSSSSILVNRMPTTGVAEPLPSSYTAALVETSATVAPIHGPSFDLSFPPLARRIARISLSPVAISSQTQIEVCVLSINTCDVVGNEQSAVALPQTSVDTEVATNAAVTDPSEVDVNEATVVRPDVIEPIAMPSSTQPEVCGFSVNTSAILTQPQLSIDARVIIKATLVIPSEYTPEDTPAAVTSEEHAALRAQQSSGSEFARTRDSLVRQRVRRTGGIQFGFFPGDSEHVARLLAQPQAQAQLQSQEQAQAQSQYSTTVIEQELVNYEQLTMLSRHRFSLGASNFQFDYQGVNDRYLSNQPANVEANRSFGIAVSSDSDRIRVAIDYNSLSNNFLFKDPEGLYTHAGIYAETHAETQSLPMPSPEFMVSYSGYLPPTCKDLFAGSTDGELELNHQDSECTFCLVKFRPTVQSPAHFCSACINYGFTVYCSTACQLADSYGHCSTCALDPMHEHTLAPPIISSTIHRVEKYMIRKTPGCFVPSECFRQQAFSMLCRTGMFPNIMDAWNSIKQYGSNGDRVPDSFKRPADYFIFRSALTSGDTYQSPADVIYCLDLPKDDVMKLPLRRLLNACYVEPNFDFAHLLCKMIHFQISHSQVFGSLSSACCFATQSEVIDEFNRQFVLEFSFPIGQISLMPFSFLLEWEGVLPSLERLEQEHTELKFWMEEDRRYQMINE